MHCQNCEFEITSNMTHAVRQNVCPACGDQIMTAEKMQQYHNLRRVLSRHQLTTNPGAEAKLREKLMAILLQHFDFVLIQSIEAETDLIDLDDGADLPQEAVQPLKSAGRGNSEDSKEGGGPRRISRGGSRVEDKKHVMGGAVGDSADQMRREVYEETYGEQGDSLVLQDDDGDMIDLEEAKDFFPGHENEVGTELDQTVVEQQVKSLQEVAELGGGGGRIRRLNS